MTGTTVTCMRLSANSIVVWGDLIVVLVFALLDLPVLVLGISEHRYYYARTLKLAIVFLAVRCPIAMFTFARIVKEKGVTVYWRC